MWQSLQQPLRSCLSPTCRCPAVDGSRERLAPEVYHRLRTQKAATARDETRNRAKAVAKAAVKDGHLRNTEVQRTRAAAEHQRKLAAQVKAVLLVSVGVQQLHVFVVLRYFGGDHP